MEKEKLVIGVVGGMGSYATVDFFRRLVDAFPAEKDWERPRIFIDNYTAIPSRVRAVLYNERKEELIDCLASSIGNLMEIGANKIIVSCNTAHIFLPEVLERIPKGKDKVLNLIDLCVKECLQREYREANLLASEGTIQTGIYEKAFSNYGIKIISPEESKWKDIRILIEDVKQGKISEKSLQLFYAMVRKNRNPTILGCSELPVLYDRCIENRMNLGDIVDPLQCAIEELRQGQG